MRATRIVLLTVLLALGWARIAGAGEKPAWSHIVVIGASVSHGFTLEEPIGEGPKTKLFSFDRFLDAALLAPHDHPVNVANVMFFMIPDDAGHTQVRQALTNNPTMVVGIDFLFWFCYGRGATDRDRAEHFEKGLKMLEEIRCPLIVGDIPDASAAVNRMLSPREVPSAKARVAANKRLAEWAAQHKNVTVVPATEFMRKVYANESINLHGHVLPAGTTRSLLQADRLHTNQRGSAALAISIFDVYLESQHLDCFSEIRWDPKEVMEKAR